MDRIGCIMPYCSLQIALRTNSEPVSRVIIGNCINLYEGFSPAYPTVSSHLGRSTSACGVIVKLVHKDFAYFSLYQSLSWK